MYHEIEIDVRVSKDYLADFCSCQGEGGSMTEQRKIVDGYTWVTIDTCVCDDCGAFGPSVEEVEHYLNCQPGESERWLVFYDEAVPEEDS